MAGHVPGRFAGTATRFGFSLGGGINLAVTEWLWLRAQMDLRLAFLGGGTLFCSGEGDQAACLVEVGDVYVQGNGSGGVMLRF